MAKTLWERFRKLGVYRLLKASPDCYKLSQWVSKFHEGKPPEQHTTRPRHRKGCWNAAPRCIGSGAPPRCRNRLWPLCSWSWSPWSCTWRGLVITHPRFAVATPTIHAGLPQEPESRRQKADWGSFMQFTMLVTWLNWIKSNPIHDDAGSALTPIMLLKMDGDNSGFATATLVQIPAKRSPLRSLPEGLKSYRAETWSFSDRFPAQSSGPPGIQTMQCQKTWLKHWSPNMSQSEYESIHTPLNPSKKYGHLPERQVSAAHPSAVQWLPPWPWTLGRSRWPPWPPWRPWPLWPPWPLRLGWSGWSRWGGRWRPPPPLPERRCPPIAWSEHIPWKTFGPWAAPTWGEEDEGRENGLFWCWLGCQMLTNCRNDHPHEILDEIADENWSRSQSLRFKQYTWWLVFGNCHLCLFTVTPLLMRHVKASPLDQMRKGPSD